MRVQGAVSDRILPDSVAKSRTKNPFSIFPKFSNYDNMLEKYGVYRKVERGFICF